MKRIIAVLLTLALLGAFAACGKPKTAADWLSLGEKYLLELDYEQAIVALGEAIKLEPKEPSYRVVQIIVYVLDDDPAGAQEAQQQAQDDDVPNFPDMPPIPDRPDDLKPEEFFPPVIDWLSSNGWVDFVLRLLELLHRRWPGVAWFGEELERMQPQGESKSEATTIIQVPEGVFTEKHIEALGISKDIDPYALAAMFGYSRNEITRTDQHGYYGYFSEGNKFQLYYYEENGELSLFLSELRIPFPMGFRIGMSFDEVARIVYSENDIFSHLIGRDLVDLDSIPYTPTGEDINEQGRHVWHHLYNFSDIVSQNNNDAM